MHIVVGLGNPGAQYANTRHNIGFMALDAIHERHGFLPWRSRFQGLTSEGTINGEKICLIKPQTFMNLSGACVQAALQFYKIPVSEIIVIHDELDLAPAEIRMKQGGGDAGHNGLKSISKALGGTYYRVRIGIGHPRALNLPIEVSDYVLARIPAEEVEKFKSVLERISHEAGCLIINKSLKNNSI